MLSRRRFLATTVLTGSGLLVAGSASAAIGQGSSPPFGRRCPDDVHARLRRQFEDEFTASSPEDMAAALNRATCPACGGKL